MSTIDEIYGSPFLRASDVKKPTSFKILKAEPEELKDGSTKLIISFENNDKKLVLNKTNALMIEESLGPDYTKWVGNTLTLASVPTQYQGESTKGLRVLHVGEK